MGKCVIIPIIPYFVLFYLLGWYKVSSLFYLMSFWLSDSMPKIPTFGVNIMLEQFKARLEAVNAKGIKTPKTLTVLFKRAEDVIRLAELTGGSEFTETQLTKLFEYIEVNLAALETKEPPVGRVTVAGERHLSDEMIQRRVIRYNKTVYELSLLREEMKRRISEMENTLKAIESDVPMSQASQFKDLVNLLGQAVNPAE